MNTGLAPQGMAFNRDASKLYVHNFMARSVSVFDTTDFINAVNNASAELGEIATVGNETVPPQVLADKRIFHDASDPRTNRDGYISCASCHSDEGSDGQVWDFTQAGEGLRNTITLVGKSGMGQGNVHWTANFDEIRDLENDIRNGFGGRGFRSDADVSVTVDPLGSPEARLSGELGALAASVSSLGTTPSSPYRNPDGTLTPDGEASRQIFEARDCGSCHSGPFFTDSLRHDVGTIQASSGLGIGQQLQGIGFETPTLVGIWDTGPYLHNGQAATLQDVLSNPAHTDTDGLTPIEVNQLVSYLLQVDLVDLLETIIISGPPVITTDTTASFSFTASLSRSTFECDLDGGGFSPWTSPKSYSALGVGSYTFQVRGTDAAGNPDPTPASHVWTVDVAPPGNKVPLAQDRSDSTGQDVPLSVQLAFTDPDGPGAYAFTIVTPPSQGGLTDFGPNPNYTPTPGFAGSDASQNVGVGVNPIWTSINGAHQTLGYSKAGVNTALAVVSGPAQFSVAADLDTRTYSVTVNGSAVGSSIPFEVIIPLDTVRFVTDGLNERNFSGRTFDGVNVSSAE